MVAVWIVSNSLHNVVDTYKNRSTHAATCSPKVSPSVISELNELEYAQDGRENGVVDVQLVFAILVPVEFLGLGVILQSQTLQRLHEHGLVTQSSPELKNNVWRATPRHKLHPLD